MKSEQGGTGEYASKVREGTRRYLQSALNENKTLREKVARLQLARSGEVGDFQATGAYRIAAFKRLEPTERLKKHTSSCSISHVPGRVNGASISRGTKTKEEEINGHP